MTFSGTPLSNKRATVWSRMVDMTRRIWACPVPYATWMSAKHYNINHQTSASLRKATTALTIVEQSWYHILSSWKKRVEWVFLPMKNDWPVLYSMLPFLWRIEAHRWKSCQTLRFSHPRLRLEFWHPDHADRMWQAAGIAVSVTDLGGWTFAVDCVS